jgi:phosphoserine phosphatase RsbU/P
VNSVLERNEAGAPIVIRTAVFDATERREYERELVRAKERAEESEAHARLLARTLQQTLIPPAPPSIPGLDVATDLLTGARRPVGGGDFYDVFQLGPDDWVVAVGDVRGKGVEAAVVTALARYTIRAAAVAEPALHEVLHTLNRVLLRHGTERFCTVALLRLCRTDPDEPWKATISCGGHAPPLLVRPGDRPRPVGVPGALLGVFETEDFRDTDIVLEPGDALVAYTDGVTEGRRGREWYGEERLEAALVEHGGSATSLTEGTLGDVLSFQGDDPRDDIVIVAVRVPA